MPVKMFMYIYYLKMYTLDIISYNKTNKIDIMIVLKTVKV